MISNQHDAEDLGPPSPLETRLLFYGCLIIAVIAAAVAVYLNNP